MAAGRGLVLTVAVLWVLCAEGKDPGWSEKKNSEGKVVQELKIEAPSMTEEDQYGHVMPERYRCDSCKAVMFHLDKDLRNKHPKSRRLKAWEYTDMIEAICRGGFEGYGIKLVNGENALSGPGIKNDDSLAPGMGAIQMGGETWGKRLGEICRKIVFEKVGEEEFYDMFYRKLRAEEKGDDENTPDLVEALCFKELRECSKGPKPPPKAKEEEKKAKADKADKAAKKAEKAAKAKAKAAKAEEASRRTEEVKAPGDKIDVQTFMRSLAVKHGLTSDEYLAPRTAAEWEKQMVGLAGRIFSKQEL